MSDVPICHTYILVTDGPLIGPFFSEEDAKEWAKSAGMAYKRIERLEHQSGFPYLFSPEAQETTKS
ncbi:hypothetical protein [Dechloromonas denitrificans]|uniref:hypothetical protein n=1 Tax=Dechloromonas denitrificans TaxID=281362 RepID=UPI001CF84246|nr:hypothetical protein [Dechloromonas denitrificans]UCV01862.1 hypothetical protein KI611_12125 [Dechloromonas denitrificans]